MKTTAKIKGLLASGILLLTASQMNAQEVVTIDNSKSAISAANYEQGFRLGFGLNGGYMLDEPFDGLALGADVRLQYDLSKRTSLTLTTGYNHLFIDNHLEDLGFKDVGMIPVKAGFKAFFWEDSFYALGELGGGFVVSKDRPFTDKNTVILAPGIGYANKWIDVSARYEHYTEFETGQIALRIAYGFKL